MVRHPTGAKQNKTKLLLSVVDYNLVNQGVCTTVSNLGNTLLTRLRVCNSSLHLHRYTIGQGDDPVIRCHFKEESSKHFILDCFLYTAERQTLYNLVKHFVTKFSKMTKAAKFDLLMYGFKSNDPDYNDLNFKISFAVQNVITPRISPCKFSVI